MPWPFQNPEIGSSLYDFKDILVATVIERPNRFVVVANLTGKVERCHLHDPGRLTELIFPGNRIMITEAVNGKLPYRVIAAERNHSWVLTDSGIHPSLARKFLVDGFVPEFNFLGRRFDFAYLVGDRPVIVEVKGCSLSRDGIALFPDAPTVRGTDQLKKLSMHLRNGGSAYVFVLVFAPQPECFSTNRATDPLFDQAFREFIHSGGLVKISAFRTLETGIFYSGELGLCL